MTASPQYSVKILGAGSIGNHLAHAARSLGWSVTLCDINPAALERTRTQIYPARYGKWDDAIRLCAPGEVPCGGFDMIFIGTPPDARLDLALAALAEKPRLLMIEKPACTPDSAQIERLAAAAAVSGLLVNVGYDHVLAQSIGKVEALLATGAIGAPLTLDVEFREHWGGILKAHPWLQGPWETYLGHWRRGGGAGGEHSHATNLWQHLAHSAGQGATAAVSAMVDLKTDHGGDYDALFALHLRTTTGFHGRVVQDVVTQPPRKWARIQGTQAAIEWLANQGPRGDVVRLVRPDGAAEEFDFPKTRPDDFIQELRHFDDLLAGRTTQSPTSLARGLDTMRVVEAAYRARGSGWTPVACSG